MSIEDEMKYLPEPLSHISLSALALARELATRVRRRHDRGAI
jgi:hypothetical protein